MNLGDYDAKMDIWSVGCIMAELIILRPLFPGINFLDELDKIFNVLGAQDLKKFEEKMTPGL